MTEKPLKIRKSLIFFLLCPWAWQGFLLKNPKFSDNSNTCLLLGCLMVWAPSVPHRNEHCRSTTQAGIRHSTWHRVVPLQHSEMQKLYTIIHSEGFFTISFILHQETCYHNTNKWMINWCKAAGIFSMSFAIRGNMYFTKQKYIQITYKYTNCLYKHINRYRDIYK